MTKRIQLTYGSKSHLIIGKVPSTTEPPTGCYVFLPGTGQDIRNDHYYEEFLDRVVSRGLCAVAVMYSDWWIASYPAAHIGHKASEVFNEALENSAINVMKRHCACNDIVVHGFSQGAHISALAYDYTKNVRGVLMFSGGCQANFFDHCAEVLKRTIPRSRIRGISSQKDTTLGCGWGDSGRTSIHQVKLTTGVDCDAPCSSDGSPTNTPNDCCAVGGHGDSFHACPIADCDDQCSCSTVRENCLTPDGGGYYIIKRDDDDRGHEWFLENKQTVWPLAWTTSDPWNVGTQLDWLVGRIASSKPPITVPSPAKGPSHSDGRKSNGIDEALGGLILVLIIIVAFMSNGSH